MPPITRRSQSKVDQRQAPEDSTGALSRLVGMGILVVCVALGLASFVGLLVTGRLPALHDRSAEAGAEFESQRPLATSQNADSGSEVIGATSGRNDLGIGRVGDGSDGQEVIIALPGGGELVLIDSELQMEVDSGGNVVAINSGTATLELPTVGALAGAFVDRALPSNVGMASGAELRHLKAHLLDDHQYLYFDLGDQEFELFLDLDRQFPGAGVLPQRISTIGTGGSSMFITDLDGDYFYLSTECEALIPNTSPDSLPSQPQRQDALKAPAASMSGFPLASVDVSNFSPGGCGVGWSVGGKIPFHPLMSERKTELPDDFLANLVLDGTVPVHSAASLDGELYFRFDPEGSTVWANAELDVGLQFLDGALEVKIPAANGTIGLSIGERSFDLWVTASAGTELGDGTAVELLADITPLSGTLDLDGELHFVDGEIQSNSFLELAGEMHLTDRSVVAIASGVESKPTFTALGIVRVDEEGVRIQGTVEVSPVSFLAMEGTGSLDVRVPFNDPANGYIEVVGNLSLGETLLGAGAIVRLDRHGVRALGELQLAGMAAVSVEGWLGPDGFQLSGSAEVTLPIGDLDRVAATLVNEASNAEQIGVLNAQVDERVEELAAANPAKGSELRNTIRDFRVAFADVGLANDNIRINNEKIADVQHRIQADIDWHWALSDIDRFFDTGPHGVRLAALYAEQAVFETANVANYVYRDTANALLSSSQQIALGVVGWDDELNGLVTLQAEAYWGTLTGNVLATVLNGADLILDAFGIDGSAVGAIYFTVGTEGVGATAELRWCRDEECSVLLDATVSLAPTVEVCGTILGVRTCTAGAG